MNIEHGFAAQAAEGAFKPCPTGSAGIRAGGCPIQFCSRLLAFTLMLVALAGRTPPQTVHAETNTAAANAADLSPTALVTSPDGQTLYIACAASKQVLVFDAVQRRTRQTLTLPASPSGLALSADGQRLFVTCAAPSSQVCVLQTRSGKLLSTLPAGHTALAPVLSRDGNTLFVCNRFDNTVSLLDVRQGTEITRIPVTREPVSAAFTADGRFLLVANHLPAGRSDVPYVAATVSVIDVATRQVLKNLPLPNGSINLRDLRVSPDGKYACVAHTVGRFQLPVTQLQRGWINTSALTLINLASLEVLNTVLLDDPDRGAANPWGVAWSADSRFLCITHAGTHELSIINFPEMLKKLSSVSTGAGSAQVPNDLSFVYNLRRRVKLNGNGPRAVAMVQGKAFVANYFSDTLDVVDLAAERVSVESVALWQAAGIGQGKGTGPETGPAKAGTSNLPQREMSVLRRGEMYFNDATLCFQGWQSCASCHDDDARVDALNWDLLNDGIGNPKDTKSLVLSHKTPPSMSLGVRSTASVAVRNGIQNSLASVLPEAVPVAMDEWLKSLQPQPSPHLVKGQLSEAARRGEQLFRSAEAGCSACHEPPLFTDLRSYAVGTESALDQQATEFDTPTLRELWRTAPYLHDGSAATLRDVLTTRNPKDQHGNTSQLSPRQIEDLVEYLLSL
jgi:YVTN family beta-propeller protein